MTMPYPQENIKPFLNCIREMFPIKVQVSLGMSEWWLERLFLHKGCFRDENWSVKGLSEHGVNYSGRRLSIFLQTGESLSTLNTLDFNGTYVLLRVGFREMLLKKKSPNP